MAYTLPTLVCVVLFSLLCSIVVASNNISIEMSWSGSEDITTPSLENKCVMLQMQVLKNDVVDVDDSKARIVVGRELIHVRLHTNIPKLLPSLLSVSVVREDLFTGLSILLTRETDSTNVAIWSGSGVWPLISSLASKKQLQFPASIKVAPAFVDSEDDLTERIIVTNAFMTIDCNLSSTPSSSDLSTNIVYNHNNLNSINTDTHAIMRRSLCSSSSTISSFPSLFATNPGQAQYSNNMNCYWYYSYPSPKYQILTVTFSNFSTELNCDIFRLYGGTVPSSSQQPAILAASGPYLPASYSFLNSLTAWFHSDQSIVSTGVAGLVDASAPLVCNGTVYVGASTTPVVLYTNPRQSTYSNNMDCYWIIRSAAPVTLSFSTFNTEASNDFLNVYAGAVVSPSNLLATLSGISVPTSYTTQSDMALWFHSDSTIIANGIVASVTSNTVCAGAMHISNFPFTLSTNPGQTQYNNNMNCYWYFVAPANEVVTITFSSFSTESCCDHLSVYSSSYASSSNRLLYASGYSIPDSVSSSGQYMTVQFTTDGSITSYGVVATVTVGPPSSHSSMSAGAVAGIVVGSIFAFFGLIFFLIQRRRRSYTLLAATRPLGVASRRTIANTSVQPQSGARSTTSRVTVPPRAGTAAAAAPPRAGTAAPSRAAGAGGAAGGAAGADLPPPAYTPSAYPTAPPPAYSESQPLLYNARTNTLVYPQANTNSNNGAQQPPPPPPPIV